MNSNTPVAKGVDEIISDEKALQSKTEMTVSPPSRRPFWKRKKANKGKDGEEEEDNLEEHEKPVPYWMLFKYSSNYVRLLLGFSLLCAIGHGTMLPILTIVFGDIIDDISKIYLPSDGTSVSALAASISDTTRIFLILAFVAWVISTFQLFFAVRAANALANTLRHKFFKALLRQPPPFYDSNSPGSLSQLVIADITLIQGGTGDKLATAVQYVTTFITSLIVGFIKGWQLTLVILGVTPILLISGFAFGQASSDATGDSLGSYSAAGGIATEILSLIRTVTTFSAQESEAKRYDVALKKAYKGSAKSAIYSGAGLASAMFCILCTYGLAFWFGGLKVSRDEMKVGDVLVTFFALTLGASSLGTAGPAFKTFSKARAAAPRVYNVIETVSNIDPVDDDAGDIIAENDLKGELSFTNIDFNYPNRIIDDAELADQQKQRGSNTLSKASNSTTASTETIPNVKNNLVLNNFNLDINQGCSEALVGKSGSGKSTIARLIQRLYDPISGQVLLDGIDIRTLNVRWLRNQIGVVAQTPSLFMLSVRDNIALGSGVRFNRDNGKTIVKDQDVSLDDIIKAAKLANAHDFIMKLPQGYDTMLGERGTTLSGGQKQRVCIARALIRNPKILVLDESTASLDTESERIVQSALENASKGRTTITIAHRLSTVRNSKNISCIQNGSVIERGSHDDLINKENGFYKGLFELQDIERAKLQEERQAETQEGDAQLVSNADTIPGKNTSKALSDSVSQHMASILADQEASMKGEKKKKKKESDVDKGVFMRTVRMNLKEWPFFFIGSAGAVAAGIVWPLSSIVLVEMIAIMSQPDINMDDVRYWALAFVVLAVVALFGNFMQHASLGVSGEKLTLRLRSTVFRSLLSQEMGYFDKNPAGVLTTLLAQDVGAVKGLTGDLLGVGINVLASLISGLTIAFIACWRLTLVVLAIFPGVALSGYFEMQASAGIDSGARKEFASANAIAVEAIDNISTVRALGKELYFLDKFTSIIRSTDTAKIKKDVMTAIAYGFSEFCQYLIWYATFKAGGDFIQNGHCTFPEILKSSMGLLFAAITLGNVSVFAPDVSASLLAATQVYRLLDRNSEIAPGSSEDEDERLQNVNGNVVSKDVYFEYPTRPNVAVLRGLSLKANSGETVAIVGQSGHGKSTIIALLQRFYNYRAGSITLDDTEITDTSPSCLRSHIGVVQQEPELFNRSVFDNIAYGLPQGFPVTQDVVEQAAKDAFAHDFIEALPQGYNTLVGERGDALSGGQRQRVAIARSLVRNPKLLLLDEATSALDGASERAVQNALDNAGKGRTTLVVAHRLSTIKNADRIVVVKKGRVSEVGTHDSLLRKNGVYSKLVENQLTEV